METTSEENSSSSKSTPSWSSATNWTTAHGSLDNSVTFETSDSPIDTIDFTRNSPLILKPPSTDSGPCEIKLIFLQKHEIRQVYVRSTARVYEIYYARALQGSNEYLCTVHCGIAARGDELVHANDTVEAVPGHTKGSDGELSEKKSIGEINGTNEDDWVQVRNPDSPLLDNGNNSLLREITVNTRSLQDFYEATAEISDADPCMTLTLRFLSLQNKGAIYVDEVYVYADPVESANLENPAVQVGNSAGSSLMAMFVPTLLHMSRSGGGRSQDKHNSNTMDKKEHTDNGSRKTDANGILNEIQQDEKSKAPDRQDVEFQEVSGVTAEEAQFQIPAQVSDSERKYNYVANGDLPYSEVGRVMEQLISRVSRIEDLCLRFEENMLKPINSIEARLQRVEDQLEVIVKNSQYSVLPSCTRFSAPAFSSLESTSSSFYNDGSANTPCGQTEIEKQDNPLNDISKSSDDNPKSVSAPQFLRSLVVTAPEFSCDEDDEENDVVEPLKDSPLEKPKQALSIDDALAAALAGFSAMTISEPLKPSDTSPKFTSTENDNDEPLKHTQSPTVTSPKSTNEESRNDEPSKYTQSLKVTAPDFTSEENENDDKVVSPRIENQNLEVSTDSCATSGDECILDSVSTSSNASLVVELRQAEIIFNNVHFEDTSKGGDGLDQFCEGRSDGSSLGTTIYSPSARAKGELMNDDYQVTEDTSAQEASNRKSKVSILERFEILRQLLANQTKDSIDSTQERAGASIRDVEKGSEEELSAHVSKSSYASVLDFETPILEVKFASWENSSSDFSLEALLTDAEIEFEATVQKGDDGVTTEDQSNLSSVNDEERMILPCNDHLLVDLESYDVQVSSYITGEELQEPLTGIKQEMFVSLI